MVESFGHASPPLSISTSGSNDDVVVITTTVPSQGGDQDLIEVEGERREGGEREEEEVKEIEECNSNRDVLPEVCSDEANFIDDEFDLMFEGLASGSDYFMATPRSPSPPAKHHEPLYPTTTCPSPSRLESCEITPARGNCNRVELLSDENITPMPDYLKVNTPFLKNQCVRYGLKALPKRKMISKLKEIYTYTHPLVGELSSIVIMALCLYLYLPPLPPSLLPSLLFSLPQLKMEL